MIWDIYSGYHCEPKLPVEIVEYLGCGKTGQKRPALKRSLNYPSNAAVQPANPDFRSSSVTVRGGTR